MFKKKSEYYLVYDGEIEARPTNRLRYLLIGMLVSTVLVGGIAFMIISSGYVTTGQPYSIYPTQRPSATIESPGISFIDWPRTLKIDSLISIAVSPDGQTLAVLMAVEGDYALQLRHFDGVDISQSSLMAWVPVHTGVTRVRFSPDGKLVLLSGGMKIGWNKTEVRDSTTGLLRFSLDGSEAAFSPDNSLMATTKRGFPPAVLVWELDENSPSRAQLVKTLFPPLKRVFQVEFSPDGTKLASNAYISSSNEQAETGLAVWEVNDWDVPPVTFPVVGDLLPYMAFTPDGQTIMVTIRGGVQSFYLNDGHYDKRGIMDGIPENVAISPDGRWMALGFNGLYPSTRFGNVYGPISIWSVRDRNEIRLMIGNSNDFPQLMDLAFAPDGSYLLSANSGNTIIQWDYITGNQIAQLKF